MPNIRDAHNMHAIEPKMLEPPVSVRIERPAQVMTRAGCERRNVSALEAVAEHASQRQVRLDGLAAVLFADDMLDLAAQKCVVFMYQAVFAHPIRPPSDQT